MKSSGAAVRDVSARFDADARRYADDVWQTLRSEAVHVATHEDMLREFVEFAVLSRDDFSSALAALLAYKIADERMPHERLEALHRTAAANDPTIITVAVADLEAIRTRDPAAEGYLTPFVYYKGFHALQWHRVGHRLWLDGRRQLAYFLQSRVSQALAVDIHPGARIGRGVFIDHGTGVVIGETSVIGNDVSMLHEVTLGGTGKEQGDRHPKVRDGVLLAAGAKILGNIEIGRASKVGAGSVVLKDVSARTTVAGVPARVVGTSRDVVPAWEMDQSLPELDYSI
jgi:serine O-acetyltransferase